MVMRMSLEIGVHKKLIVSDKNTKSDSESRISDNSIITLKLSKTYEKFRAVDSLTIKVDLEIFLDFWVQTERARLRRLECFVDFCTPTRARRSLRI